MWNVTYKCDRHEGLEVIKEVATNRHPVVDPLMGPLCDKCSGSMTLVRHEDLRESTEKPLPRLRRGRGFNAAQMSLF